MTKVTRHLDTTLPSCPGLWPLHANKTGVCGSEVYLPQQHNTAGLSSASGLSKLFYVTKHTFLFFCESYCLWNW